MRVLGDPDVLLPTDVALRSGAKAIGIDPERLEEWAAGVAPWRSYLCAHLWRAVPPRAPRTSPPRSGRGRTPADTVHRITESPVGPHAAEEEIPV